MGAAIPTLMCKEKIHDVKVLQKGTNTIQICEILKKHYSSKLYKSKVTWNESNHNILIVGEGGCLERQVRECCLGVFKSCLVHYL